MERPQRLCLNCHTFKDISEFRRNGTCLASVCKQCHPNPTPQGTDVERPSPFAAEMEVIKTLLYRQQMDILESHGVDLDEVSAVYADELIAA